MKGASLVQPVCTQLVHVRIATAWPPLQSRIAFLAQRPLITKTLLVSDHQKRNFLVVTL